MATARGFSATSYGNALSNCPSSRRYRRVSLGAQVDNMLFGESHANAVKKKKCNRPQEAGKSIVNAGNNNDEIDKPCVSTEEQTHYIKRLSRKKHLETTPTILNASEVARIKAETTILTINELEEKEVEREAELEKLRLSAKARKEHMMKLSEAATLRAPKSKMELLKEKEKTLILDRAKVLKDQDHDSVKLLKTLGARATAFTIRDQQRKVHDELKEEQTIYDEKMNVLMEVNRLEGLKRQEEIDEMKKAKRYADRQVLEDQIHEQKIQRQKEAELVAHEAKDMLERIQQAQQKDLEREREKMKQVQKTMEEIQRFNEETLQRKLQQQAKVREEDAKIVEYQKRKDEEAKQLEEEQQQKRQEAELRCAKLRSMQEKLANEKSELDELRAKRAAEGRERQAREADIALAKKQKAEMEILHQSRSKQASHHQLARIKEATLQQQEYESIMKQVQEDKRKVLKEEERKKVASMSHRVVLQQQIEEKENLKKQEFLQKQQEGVILRQEYAKELEKLQQIRKEEVQELINAGVNPVYLAEMTALDIEKLRNR